MDPAFIAGLRSTDRRVREGDTLSSFLLSGLLRRGNCRNMTLLRSGRDREENPSPNFRRGLRFHLFESATWSFRHSTVVDFVGGLAWPDDHGMQE